MPFLDRASRDYDFVPSIGGKIQLQQYNAAGQLVGSPADFDIEVHRLRNIYFNKITTHSGSNGATLRTRTGGDWNFNASLSSPQDGFIELLLGHWRGVAIAFYLGDPLWYTSQGLVPLSYRATKFLLEENTIITDSRAKDVVRLDFKGVGNSLLWGYLGEQPISADLWP